MTVTPVIFRDADEIALVIFQTPGPLRGEDAKTIMRGWKRFCKGTPLAGKKVLIVLADGLEIKFERVQ